MKFSNPIKCVKCNEDLDLKNMSIYEIGKCYCGMLFRVTNKFEPPEVEFGEKLSNFNLWTLK